MSEKVTRSQTVKAAEIFTSDLPDDEKFYTICELFLGFENKIFDDIRAFNDYRQAVESGIHPPLVNVMRDALRIINSKKR